MDKEAKTNNSPYEPSEVWKKYHEKNKLIEPAKEPSGEYYWEKMIKEKEEQEQINAEDTRYFRSLNIHSRQYDDEERIMKMIMDGEGDTLGY